jgi:hypothetical protein
MTDHQQPDLGPSRAEAVPFLAVCSDPIKVSHPEAAPSEPWPSDWETRQAELDSIRHSMPADFADIDLEDAKAPSADQLARRARLQRVVWPLVALIGLFDLVMLWAHYR